jgi:Iron-sulfur cluster-binding domain
MADKAQVEKLVKDSTHFCVLPWVHFHAWPDSRVMPCCVADSNMPVAKVDSDQSILEMMNSPEYKKMRNAMLEDKPVEACKRCYDLELMGTWTMRQSHNRRRGLEYVDYIAGNTQKDGSLSEFEMKYMDIRFSNLCNMKCRSCGPDCSSQWAQEFVDKRGKEAWDEYFPNRKVIINNNEDQQFMLKLKPYLADVTEVYFAGGEIIITPEHYECLDYWIESGQCETIELNYTTNFSTLHGYKDKNLLEYWSKFKNIQVWASLDAHGPLAECIRKGTDWGRAEKNIRELKEKLPHVQFQITPTISIWNIFKFPDFFDYMVENKLIDLKTCPRFNLATFPWYANIMILPKHVKNRLVELYRVYQNKYGRENVDVYNGFKMIIYNLTSGEENKGGILEFKQFNDELDKFRNEKFEDLVPEIKEVYEWAAN